MANSAQKTPSKLTGKSGNATKSFEIRAMAYPAGWYFTAVALRDLLTTLHASWWDIVNKLGFRVFQLRGPEFIFRDIDDPGLQRFGLVSR